MKLFKRKPPIVVNLSVTTSGLDANEIGPAIVRYIRKSGADELRRALGVAS